MKNSITLIVFFCLCFVGTAAQNMNNILGQKLADKEKADTVFKYARKYFQRGKFDSAGIWLDAGLPYALKSGMDTLISQYYVEKGNLGFMQSKTQVSLTNLWNAQYWLNKTFHYHNLNSCYIVLAKCHAKLNNTDSALLYLRRSEELSSIYNPYRRWIAYQEMGSLFANADNFAEAEKYFEKAYQITKEKGNRFDHGLTMYNLAQFYFKRKKPEKFAQLLNEQQEFVKATKKDFSKDPVHSFLFVEWGKETTLPAKVLFLTTVRDKLLEDNFIINASLVNEEIAGLYEKENQFAEALKYIQYSIRLSENEKNASNMYVYSKTAYRILKKAGQTKEANEMADRLFALKDSIATRQNLELAMDLDAKYQTEKKQQQIGLLNSQKLLSEKEIQLLNLEKERDKNAISILNSNNELNAKTIALLNADKKFDALKILQQIEQREALEREGVLSDSVLKSEMAINNAVRKEKENEAALNAALGRENSLKETELGKERKLRWSLMGGALVLLLSGVSIFVLYRKQKGKNAIIQKQSDSMEILIKEIHHRVKNNMQVVSSLLDLQSHTIKDVQASEAVKEGRNRVQSMALIHQNLYSEDNLKGIKAKEYIGNLMQSLCDSYNISNDKIKIVTDIDDLNLDVDTMIPLGLILNELLSNVFKYAFPKDAMHKQTNIGELNLVLKKQNESLYMKVYDNGIGFPDGLDTKNSKSFGLKMIKAFAQKLKAKVDIYNNNGAVVEMLITKYQMA